MIRSIVIKEDFESYKGKADESWYMQAMDSPQAFKGYKVDALPVGHTIDLDSRVVCITGPKGSGKSTLLRKLEYHIGLFKLVREEPSDEVPEVPDYFDITGDDVSVGRIDPLPQPKSGPYGRDYEAEARKSSGEWDWDNYVDMISRDLSEGRTYVLDQPDKNLDPAHEIRLARMLNERAVSQNVQFFVVTHSHILLTELGSKVLSFYDTPAKTYQAGDFDLMARARELVD